MNTCGVQNSGAIFAWENINQMPVLFDTGAQVSVISIKYCGKAQDLLPVTVKNLKGVTGRKINALGMCIFPLDIGFSRVLSHTFVVVDLDLPYAILGIDFMQANGVILDPRAKTVFLPYSRDRVPLSTFSDVVDYSDCVNDSYKTEIWEPLTVGRVTVRNDDKDESAKLGEEQCYKLLQSFPELTSLPDYNKPAKHPFRLDVDLIDNTPILQKPRKFTKAEHEVIKRHMEDLVKKELLLEERLAMCHRWF